MKISVVVWRKKEFVESFFSDVGNVFFSGWFWGWRCFIFSGWKWLVAFCMFSSCRWVELHSNLMMLLWLWWSSASSWGLGKIQKNIKPYFVVLLNSKEHQNNLWCFLVLIFCCCWWWWCWCWCSFWWWWWWRWWWWCWWWWWRLW